MALAGSVHSSSPGRGVRPLDPFRDLPEVVQLIALGFGAELDPPGRKMLAQLRATSRRGVWTRLLLGPVDAPRGFVWSEGQRVVGNLSLRQALPRTQAGWLIGNVVVHPEYRGRGIGRALLDAALGAVRARGARWVGLEVRADNPVARGLYAHSGFRSVGETVHCLRSPGMGAPAFPAPRDTWRRSRPEDSMAWGLLADQVFTPFQRQVLEIRPSFYTYGGWERAVQLWLRGQREWAWLETAVRPRRAVQVRQDCRRRFFTWELLSHPEDGVRAARETVAQALQVTRRAVSWLVATTVEQNSPLLTGLFEAGFHQHRRLLQMVLRL